MLKYNILIAVMLLLLFLSGCGQKAPVKKQTEEQTSKATITIEPPRQ